MLSTRSLREPETWRLFWTASFRRSGFSPAIDILKSGTRRDDLLLTQEESEAVDIIHKATNTQKPEESVERILDLFAKTRNNQEFVDITRKRRFF